ncbi:hypothetical protein [Shewanella xiamenensis]|uniref:hypothetical protein n=1 Tax=Shewanella xiamenensis TaxID=332186 RepID=UPI00217EF89F|nr:hypothetical protein [Shewanella xiamenensis]MCT8871535.1 hypothetical protein [Shewanella xiamenensis]UWH43624.1 hypothetical protein KXJ80_10485 [Shewanella xiamenensis]
MAFETINLGTQPAGTGGDTARSAFEKTNRNFLAAEVLSAAMSQAQFEAIRAQNKERYAASAWVSFGNHEAGKQVNECKPGLYTSLTTPNTLLIGKAGGVGGSKTDHGVLCMAGVIFHLPLAYPIRLARAPDGKTTYNKITGVITNHATVAAAFNAQAADPVNVEVVINRVDMWGFEAFPQEVTPANPEIYPQGVFSDLFTSMNGIPTSDSARPVSYFGFLGKKAKKVDFFALSDAQKKKVLADPKNNLYYSDDGRLIQWVLRGREFSGPGNGDWNRIENTIVDALNFKGGIYVGAQGYYDVPAPSSVSENDIYLTTKHPNGQNEIGCFSTGKDSQRSINGECYFLVCGTVNRLNQGVYHPSWNNSGASKACSQDGGAAVSWNASNVRNIESEQSCFILPTSGYPFLDGIIYPDSGVIGGAGGGSGRKDNKSHNAIYSNGNGGVCRDMRYSSISLDAVDFEEALIQVKNSKYRGCEKIYFCKPFNSKNVYLNFNASQFDLGDSNDLGLSVGDSFFAISTETKAVLFGSKILNTRFPIVTKLSGIPLTDLNSTYYFITVKALNEPVGGSFLQNDVIGDPLNILSTPQLTNGWKGNWVNPFVDKYYLSRDVVSQSISKIFTINNGVSWSFEESNIDAVNNYITKGSESLVMIVQYSALATQTEPAPNATLACLVPYNVFASSDYRPENGALLGESLIGKVLKNNSGVTVNNKSLSSCAIDGSGKLTSATNFDGVTHPALTLGAPANNSPAFKAVSYLANINQQAVPHFAFTELKHNGSSWGDDGKVTIVDNQATKTDLNGNTVLVGTAKLKEPIGWIKNKV